MRYYVNDDVNRKLVLSLDEGEDVLKCIKEAVKIVDFKNAVVVSAIGTLSQAMLHMIQTTGYPPKELFPRWEDKPLELCSIDGMIINYMPHLHTVISNSLETYAGHLEEDCKVLYLCEILIEELTGFDVERVPQKNGVTSL